MTPQLFINYKLKSVAHLPWRMLTYKALNTFIDDLFAFVIKMPMMYRIGCLRDGESKASIKRNSKTNGFSNSRQSELMYIVLFCNLDVVFFIYLYQRWIYRVDLTRMNEFGTSGEDIVKSQPDGSPKALMEKGEEEKKND